MAIVTGQTGTAATGLDGDRHRGRLAPQPPASMAIVTGQTGTAATGLDGDAAPLPGEAMGSGALARFLLPHANRAGPIPPDPRSAIFLR
jgi:hypothetical protein